MSPDTAATLDGTADLAACDREPIHVPGAIQPHGVLLALREPALEVVQASTSTADHLGVQAAALLGTPLDDVLGADGAAEVRAAAASGDPRAASPLRLRTRAGAEERAWDGVLHRSGGLLVLELEPAAEEETRAAAVFLRVRGGLARVQGARTAADLCAAIAVEVRALTGMDRVMVYRFDADWNGEVVAEARGEGVDPFLGLHFPATDIPAQARALYRRNWLRLIAASDYRPSPLVPAENPLTGTPLDLSESTLRSVSPVHLEYLRNMEVGASLSVSLLRDGELWGLVACHHHAPRHVPFETRAACELLGQAFSVQLGAVADAEETARTAEAAAAGAALLDRMAGAEDWARALTEDADALLGLAAATGAAVRRGGEWVRVGQTPDADGLDALAAWIAGRGEAVFHTDRLPHLFPGANAAVASGVLAVGLGGGDLLLWLRPEVVRTVEWAGNPEKAVRVGDDGTPRLHPRRSFAAWRETVRGRSLPWLAGEVRAAAELRERAVEIVLRHAAEVERLNHELRRSNDELDAFTYIASHDLKEPLRGIHNFSAMLLEDEGPRLGEEATGRLQTLLRLTRRMDEMIDSLLTYSRVGKLELDRDPVNLDAVLAEVRETITPRLEETGVQVRVPRPLPTVRCDRVRTAAILQNLLTNAAKYNDKPERWLEVGWRDGDTADGEVVLWVRDNGIGIAERHRDTVFRIFRRLHARDRFGGGTGAGLTIVKRLVERQGGRIWLESVPGEGTTFFFTLGAGAE